MYVSKIHRREEAPQRISINSSTLKDVGLSNVFFFLRKGDNAWGGGKGEREVIQLVIILFFFFSFFPPSPKCLLIIGRYIIPVLR